MRKFYHFVQFKVLIFDANFIRKLEFPVNLNALNFVIIKIEQIYVKYVIKIDYKLCFNEI